MMNEPSSAPINKPEHVLTRRKRAVRELQRRYRRAVWFFAGATALNALVMLMTFLTRNLYANLAWFVLLLLLAIAYERQRRAKNDLKEAEQRLARTQAKLARPHS
jgi:hypothetical protein